MFSGVVGAAGSGPGGRTSGAGSVAGLVHDGLGQARAKVQQDRCALPPEAGPPPPSTRYVRM